MTNPGSELPAGAAQGAGTDSALTVHVLGMVQGRELNAQAAVRLVENEVQISWEHATPWGLALNGLDGITQQGALLTLYLSSGDVLELSGDDGLRGFAARLMERACRVPELTRGLRALGSMRGTPGPAHDRWFAPLLAARRAIAGVSDAERQVALVDAAVVAQQLRQVIADIAKGEAANHAAMERAIEAALQEEGEPVFVALERLALSADVLRASALDTRLVDWRRWISALRDVFVAADECWPRCAMILTHGV